jgi:hypothetical protein
MTPPDLAELEADFVTCWKRPKDQALAAMLFQALRPRLLQWLYMLTAMDGTAQAETRDQVQTIQAATKALQLAIRRNPAGLEALNAVSDKLTTLPSGSGYQSARKAVEAVTGQQGQQSITDLADTLAPLLELLRQQCSETLADMPPTKPGPSIEMEKWLITMANGLHRQCFGRPGGLGKGAPFYQAMKLTAEAINRNLPESQQIKLGPACFEAIKPPPRVSTKLV